VTANTTLSQGQVRDWLRGIWYRLGTFLTAFFFLFAFSLRVFGKRNVPPTGGLLIIANHQSYLDPPVVGLAMPRRIQYIARRSLFRSRLFGWLIGSLGAAPLDDETSGVGGIKTALRLLKAGKAVLIFPEGTRTPDGVIHPLMPGIVALLRRIRVPVLPIGIAGAYECWPSHQSLPRFAPLINSHRDGITAVVGPTLDSAALADLPPKQILEILGNELQKLHQEAERLRRKK